MASPGYRISKKSRAVPLTKVPQITAPPKPVPLSPITESARDMRLVFTEAERHNYESPHAKQIIARCHELYEKATSRVGSKPARHASLRELSSIIHEQIEDEHLFDAERRVRAATPRARSPRGAM